MVTQWDTKRTQRGDDNPAVQQLKDAGLEAQAQRVKRILADPVKTLERQYREFTGDDLVQLEGSYKRTDSKKFETDVDLDTPDGAIWLGAIKKAQTDGTFPLGIQILESVNQAGTTELYALGTIADALGKLRDFLICAVNVSDATMDYRRENQKIQNAKLNRLAEAQVYYGERRKRYATKMNNFLDNTWQVVGTSAATAAAVAMIVVLLLNVWFFFLAIPVGVGLWALLAYPLDNKMHETAGTNYYSDSRHRQRAVPSKPVKPASLLSKREMRRPQAS